MDVVGLGLAKADAAGKYDQLGGNAAILMQRLAIGQENGSVLVLGDSTGVVGTSPWPLVMARWLAAKFPAYTVNYRVWSDAGQAYLATGAATGYPTGLEPQTGSQVVQIGTGTGNAGGPFVLNVWNGSVSGSQASYPIATLPRWTALVAGAPQLVLVNYGHNNSLATDVYRYAHYPLCRNIQQQFPEAGVIQIAQNPRVITDTERSNDLIRARVVIGLAASEGYGLVNVTQRFLADPNYATTLTLADGLHPNNAGSAAWADEVTKHLALGLRSQPRGPYNRSTELYLSAAELRDPSGTLTLAQVNGGGMGWTLPAGARSDLVAAFDPPEHWSQFDIFVTWTAPAGDSSKVVAWSTASRSEGLGVTDVNVTDSAVAFVGYSSNQAAGTYVTKTPYVFAGAYATYTHLLVGNMPIQGRPMGLRITRRADVANDTFVSPVHLLGVRLLRRR